ncbi:serine-threonine protein kinase, putative [Entamoeba invadens IP1]|uniref:Serine-threonine protein kinase, putative n=1 Tax=Entamoeba invadens IP1 TaxID=370355 RepID=A0A0A1U410_ENTIV|nr:serine-threonine protein kinase, putative [Entamoeba invadens IP1]ELP88967.1 serine-threonine protein kinase, putative [Entamoeba invadens IP1]|eukprot:XP_004255738.1 serine-threonine protein kinase, putative [Entamoeba invadens IP1]
MTRLMFFFLLIFSVNSSTTKLAEDALTSSVSSSSSTDNFDENCGNGLFDAKTEECDRVDGCGSDCLCSIGYTADGDGHCVPKCMYGSACINGCYKPDKCERCNESMGYTSDCSECLKDYMWFGEGKCLPYNATELISCGDFFTQTDAFFAALGKTNVFRIRFGDTGNLDENGKVVLDLSQDVLTQFQSTFNKLAINRCTRFVNPTKPYTYGTWFEVLADENGYVHIETDKKYTNAEITILNAQSKTVGTNYALSVHERCLDTADLFYNPKCTTRNGGRTDYIQSPQVFLKVIKDEKYYVFLHSKFASSQVSSIPIYFNKVLHPCSGDYQEVVMNEVASGYFSSIIDSDTTIVSGSVCTKENEKGRWYRINGVDQTLDISTCNSEEYDVSLNLIEFDLAQLGFVDTHTDDISNVTCGVEGIGKCVKYRNDGCGKGSLLPRMVVTLKKEYMYMLFVSLNEEYKSRVKLDITITCPQECGENGKCSGYSGKCECNEGYVNKYDGCSACGNGKVDIDINEECDLSSGVVDIQCLDSCNCKDGTQPKEINGVTKCAVSTCNNDNIDENEECDGGFGCYHCLCVNNTYAFAKPRLYCVSSTCGNKKWDKGEECDGGLGCIECECQPDWFGHGSADCSSLSPALTNFLFWGVGSISYFILYMLILIISLGVYIKLTRVIKKQTYNEMNIFENTIIPFDKNNSQYVDMSKENKYFSFSSTKIEFDSQPEINEPIETQIELNNLSKTHPLYFVFHSGDYTKYIILSKPFVGTIRPKESVTLNISFMAKCTTVLNEKVPITIRFGNVSQIIKEIKKENPDLIDHASQSSQNSEMDDTKSFGKKSLSSADGKEKSSSKTKSTGKDSGTKDKSSSSLNSKNKKSKTAISKFHVYLNLQVESALSTKLDYEEIHLQHPPIGGGTFGIVYRAEWRRVDVAVKVMKTDLVSLMELLPNFMQEAEMMERIRCPYIVNYIGSVMTGDTLCLVTEFCPLGSLRKYMKSNAIPELLKLRFCQDIARGMEYLHENDILHRDLKTDNVLMISKNPHDPITAKVTDFGTSRSFIESSGKKLLQGIGTPVYMAPEISRKDQMTLKSDVYSFAICMLEIWLTKDVYDPMKFPDSESILRFVGAEKRLDIDDSCVLKELIQAAWKPRASERPSFKELGTKLTLILKNVEKGETKREKDSKSSKMNDEENSKVSVTAVTTKDESVTEGESADNSETSNDSDNPTISKDTPEHNDINSNEEHMDGVRPEVAKQVEKEVTAEKTETAQETPKEEEQQ